MNQDRKAVAGAGLGTLGKFDHFVIGDAATGSPLVEGEFGSDGESAKVRDARTGEDIAPTPGRLTLREPKK